MVTDVERFFWLCLILIREWQQDESALRADLVLTMLRRRRRGRNRSGRSSDDSGLRFQVVDDWRIVRQSREPNDREGCGKEWLGSPWEVDAIRRLRAAELARRCGLRRRAGSAVADPYPASPRARSCCHRAFLWADSARARRGTNLRHLLHALHHVLLDAEQLRDDGQPDRAACRLSGYARPWPTSKPVAGMLLTWRVPLPSTAATWSPVAITVPGSWPERERLHRLCADVSTVDRPGRAAAEPAGRCRRRQRAAQHDPDEAAYRTMRLHALHAELLSAPNVNDTRAWSVLRANWACRRTQRRVARHAVGETDDATERAAVLQAGRRGSSRWWDVYRNGRTVAQWRAAAGRPQMASSPATRVSARRDRPTNRPAGCTPGRRQDRPAYGHARGAILPVRRWREWPAPRPVTAARPGVAERVAPAGAARDPGQPDPDLPPPEPLHQAGSAIVSSRPWPWFASATATRWLPFLTTCNGATAIRWRGCITCCVTTRRFRCSSSAPCAPAKTVAQNSLPVLPACGATAGRRNRAGAAGWCIDSGPGRVCRLAVRWTRSWRGRFMRAAKAIHSSSSR